MAVLILAGSQAVTIPLGVFALGLVAIAALSALAQWAVSTRTGWFKAVSAAVGLGTAIFIIWDCGWWGCLIF